MQTNRWDSELMSLIMKEVGCCCVSVIVPLNLKWCPLNKCVLSTRCVFISVSFCQCADEAMSVLHGRVVNGVKMKVMLADPPREESHKRLRTY